MEVVLPYRPRDAFKPYHAAKQRFRNVVIHRRAGKTWAFINDQIRAALEDPVEQMAARKVKPRDQHEEREWREIPRVYPIIYPQLKQAKSVAWGPLKYFASVVPGAKPNEAEISVAFPSGGVVRLFGSGTQEVDSFRGMKMWQVVFDEYQDCDPNAFHEIVRPACLETRAPVTFGGTVKGKNHLWRNHQSHAADREWLTVWLPASQSNILDRDFLEKERADYEREGKLNKYLQEYELEPMAVIEGAIFGREYHWLQENGRICDAPPDDVLHTETFWDIGIGGYTVVLFIQRCGLQSRIVDSIITQSVGLLDVARQVEKKPYVYDCHWLPHDGGQRSTELGEKRSDLLRGILRGQVRIVPRVPIKEDAIEAVRAVYKRLVIDSKQEVLLDAFAQYEQEWDEERKVFMPVPKHNWASHPCDALMQWAQVEVGERKHGAVMIRTPETHEDIHATI